MRFSDGEPLGASDAVFTFCRVLNNRDELVSSCSRIARRLKLQKVRLLLNEAVAASEDGPAVAAPPGVHAGSRLHRH